MVDQYPEPSAVSSKTSLGRWWVANRMNGQLVLSFYMAGVKIKSGHLHICNYQRPKNGEILKDRLCTIP